MASSCEPKPDSIAGLNPDKKDPPKPLDIPPPPKPMDIPPPPPKPVSVDKKPIAGNNPPPPPRKLVRKKRPRKGGAASAGGDDSLMLYGVAGLVVILGLVLFFVMEKRKNKHFHKSLIKTGLDKITNFCFHFLNNKYLFFNILDVFFTQLT